MTISALKYLIIGVSGKCGNNFSELVHSWGHEKFHDAATPTTTTPTTAAATATTATTTVVVHDRIAHRTACCGIAPTTSCVRRATLYH